MNLSVSQVIAGQEIPLINTMIKMEHVCKSMFHGYSSRLYKAENYRTRICLGIYVKYMESLSKFSELIQERPDGSMEKKSCRTCWSGADSTLYLALWSSTQGLLTLHISLFLLCRMRRCWIKKCGSFKVWLQFWRPLSKASHLPPLQSVKSGDHLSLRSQL